MYRLITFVFAVFITTVHYAQDGLLRIRPIAGVNLGFVHRPFLAATIDIGFSWSFNDRIGLLAMGVLAMNGYDYAKESYDHRIFHLTSRMELRPFWQKPMGSSMSSTLRYGLGLGLAKHGTGGLETMTGPLRTSSRAVKDTRFYLAPEVSILKKLGRHNLELGLRYVRHVQRHPAFTTSLSYGADISIATATHDHLALVVRFHLGLKPPVLPTYPIPMIEYAERSTDTLGTLAAGKERITLWLWDNGEYDGDTLSVILNDRPVLVGHELTRKRYKLRVDLLPGENHLLIVAHNEGRVSPNTASVVVRAGNRRQQLLLSTSLRRNQVVRIVRGSKR